MNVFAFCNSGKKNMEKSCNFFIAEVNINNVKNYICFTVYCEELGKFPKVVIFPKDLSIVTI